jgi:hypothetical protein
MDMPEGDFSALVCAGIDWCVQQNVDVINLSLGPDSTVFNPDDPLQRATKAAHDRGVAVVVAAGNFGPGKMQSLARAPWVISVGAVDDKERLLSDSSTGASDAEGPTVVSYGAPLEIPNPPREWERYGPGTSFAAPRVSRVAGFVRACLRLIIADLYAQQSKRWSILSEPVKFPVMGLVDTGVDPSRLPARAPIAAWDNQLGHTEIQVARGQSEERWYETVVDALKSANTACTLTHGPESVKRALVLMARKLDGYASRDVGAGLLSLDEARTFLGSLTPSRWLSIFCPEAVQKLGLDRVAALDAEIGPVWVSVKVEALKQHLYDNIQLCVAKVM